MRLKPELNTVGGPLPTLWMKKERKKRGLLGGGMTGRDVWSPADWPLGVAIAIYKRSFNIAAIKELNSREAGIDRFNKARLKTVGFQYEELL